ncbi:MAG: WD40/YVTN/BNR-like repeat-containing protein [Candidatus Hodarchaeales archaeon]
MHRRSLISSILLFFLLITPILTFPLSILFPWDNLGISSSFQAEEMPSWVRTNGPYGGLINSIEIDPSNSNTMYAAGGGTTIFKSVNGGNSWSSVASLKSSSTRITDLILSQTNSQVMYALTQGTSDIEPELFITTDGGTNWTQINQGMSVFHIALHPTNPMYLVACMWSGFVYVTTNGGNSWTNVSGNIPRAGIVDLSISGDNEYWAGVGDFAGENGSLYHTSDGGLSWEKENLNQPANSFVNSIMVHPSDNNTVYVSMTLAPDEWTDPDTNYLFRTVDGGSSWESLNTQAVLNLLAIVPSSANDTIYASYGAFVFRTNDDGINWNDITPPPVTSDINDLAIDPTDNDTIYIPKRTYGIYKSIDGGDTWVTLTEGIDNINACLIVVPNDEDSETVYVAAVEGTGTFRTDDAGMSWRYLDSGGINHSFADEIRVSPHDPETIWEIGDIGVLYISNNGGTNWTTTFHPQHGYNFRYSSVHAIESAPSDEDIIYAIKSGFGIFRSEDGGRVWDFLAQSDIDYTYTFAIHPTDPDIVYSGYNPKPFQEWAMIRKSIDGGESWDTVLNVTGSNGITSVVINPNNPNVVYAGSISETGGEVYKTFDAGQNWEKLNDNFTMCTVMAQPQLIINPNNPSIAYTSTWLGGTWKTTDSGTTWSLLRNAPISATAIRMDVTDSNILYLADRSSPSLWKSIDAGATWFDIADFSSDGAFLVNNVFANGDVIYCATFGPPTIGGKLYKSTDAGTTWNDITGILPRSVLDIAVDPASPEIVYVTTHVKGAYKSVDGGDNWTKLVNYPDIGGFDIEIDSTDPATLYTCGLGNTSIPSWVDPQTFTFADSPGVYKSIDSGLTWSSILNTSDKTRAIRIYPSNSSILYAAAHDGGIFVSQDAGATWTNYSIGLDTLGLTSLEVLGDKIYVGTQGYGVYSGDINLSDFSVTWQNERSNKPIPQVYSMQIVIDPEDSNCIYVGTYPGGLYRSDDGGVTFYDKNFQTPSIIADDPFRQGYYAFALNPSNSSEAWLGTWGGGVFMSYDRMNHNAHADGLGKTMLGKHIYQIEVSPYPPYFVYAATEEGVFLSEDYGSTWENFSVGLETLQVRSLELTSNGTLFCGTLGYEMYIYNTSLNMWKQLPPFGNLGNVWPIWNDRPQYQYSSLLFHPVDPDTVYIGTFPAGIYKSIDGGKTWFESNTGWTNDGVFTLVNHPEDFTIIYAGTYNGVSRSLDEGTSWEMWDIGWPGEQWVFSIDFDSRDPSVMYACSKNGENEGLGRPAFGGTVMKSIDGGENWYEITTGLNVTQEFFKIIVDKHNPDILYLATEREGVFISYNGGELWEPWNEGLTNLRAASSGNNVANPMVQSADGGYLYFGVFGFGVFRRTTYVEETSTTPTTTTTTTTITTTATTTITTEERTFGFQVLVILLSLGGLYSRRRKR